MATYIARIIVLLFAATALYASYPVGSKCMTMTERFQPPRECGAPFSSVKVFQASVIVPELMNTYSEIIPSGFAYDLTFILLFLGVSFYFIKPDR